MTEILYRSAALEVRRVVAGDGRRQVVTFDSYHEPPGFDRPGFGEAFFAGEGITAIHVMSYGNDWFQYPEMPEVLSMIRQACAGAERLVAYGSSMGGYGAFRFAGPIGAQAALGLSPQYSVDPRKVKFETRWASDRRRIRFIKALEGPIAQVPLMVGAYDSRLEMDTRHIFWLSTFSHTDMIPLAFAGHPIGPFLQDVGLLAPLVLGVFDPGFNAEDIKAAAHRRMKTSPHWLANVAEHRMHARGNRGIVFARRAVALAPDRPSLHDTLARRLAAAGRYEEALAAHERAIAIEPIVDYQWGLSKTLRASGDVRRALAVAERLQQLAPASPGYHAWSARLREELGDISGALSDLRTARCYDPGNRGYRFNVARLVWRSTVLRWRQALFRR